MKPVGKPDARNEHVRFDERGWEPGRRLRQHPRPSSTLPNAGLMHQHRVKPDRVRVYMLICYWSGEAEKDRPGRQQKLRDFGYQALAL
jgi:hypothetical protein